MKADRYVSWSMTRSRALAECPRRFFFEYYADGEPESYDAWNLKELVTLPMLAGEVVDLVIASALRRVQKGQPLPPGLAEVGAKEFRKFVAASPRIVEGMRERARTYETRRSGPFRPLQKDWYGLDLGPEYEKRVEQAVATCLATFEDSEVFSRIVQAGPECWGPFTRATDSTKRPA